MHWLLLAAAIVAEIIATTLLKVSAGFTKPLPSIGTVLGYVLSFYLLSLVLKYVPLSVAYAIWAAAGTVAIAVVGVVLFSEKLTIFQISGILLTAVGVAMINLGAGSTAPAPTEISSLEHQNNH
ncbi:QacE family quaternary ammonium compound efflux SMR transporter [Arthrobacter sp. MYb227]|uniref:DMT family transporter n=1 Tax=Arthrobacter sp. MYb227 TaxID=1848601 RepID=UPI000CFBE72B|nr:multidrug efflux SMR transporter [Arthrobacter sp. MYb227]PQZ94782.1 QacE family quaternary ammonium compound efflux SMR transporter [Arthrobacter sp. MYb227]